MEKSNTRGKRLTPFTFKLFQLFPSANKSLVAEQDGARFEFPARFLPVVFLRPQPFRVFKSFIEN